jgi:hypothetical protein
MFCNGFASRIHEIGRHISSLDFLKLLRKQNSPCSWDSEACTNAAEDGHGRYVIGILMSVLV